MLFLKRIVIYIYRKQEILVSDLGYVEKSEHFRKNHEKGHGLIFFHKATWIMLGRAEMSALKSLWGEESPKMSNQPRVMVLWNLKFKKCTLLQEKAISNSNLLCSEYEKWWILMKRLDWINCILFLRTLKSAFYRNQIFWSNSTKITLPIL